MVQVAYHSRYNLGFPGVQRLHPFDLRKYARAWQVLRKSLGSKLPTIRLPVTAPICDEQLKLVHSEDYLDSLRTSAIVAQAVEVPALRRAPWWLLERFLLQPMRWATAGSVNAGRAARQYGLAFNLGGGFHHAKPSGGEGFSIYNDTAVMIRVLESEGLLTRHGRIAYVDLDAHLGNGVAHCFLDESRVFLFDMHNGSIYPVLDTIARERIDCALPLRPETNGQDYLAILEAKLPVFLDSISRTQAVELAIYNAGTDVLEGDPLGGLALSLADVLTRDRFVIDTLRQRQIPTVVMTSGGYTQTSYAAIAQMILAFAER